MVKSLCVFGLVVLSGMAVPAAADWAVYESLFSIREGWPGEYAMGYKIKSDFLVSTYYDPSNPVRDSGYCTLKKGTVIHPSARGNQLEYRSVSGVSVWEALQDFELSTLTGTLQVEKGTRLRQLGELSEGYCMISVNGQLAEDSCLQEDGERTRQLIASPVQFQQYFRAVCEEGHQGWVLTSELDEGIQSGSGDVVMISVEDDGTVIEHDDSE